MIADMKNILILIVACIALVGCGKASRMEAALTGYSEECVDGVVYLQFTSGVTVKYNRDGTHATCKE
jgi:uncharacterized protein YceK